MEDPEMMEHCTEHCPPNCQEVTYRVVQKQGIFRSSESVNIVKNIISSYTPFIIGSEVDVSCVLFLDHGAGWIKTKTHETSTSEPMINGVHTKVN